VIDGINSWIHGWKKNNWKTASRQPVKNIELWQQLDDLVKRVTIEWVWVKGHSGEVMNEKVDQLANSAALRGVT
jgi:ribonuclease HI